MRWFDEVRLRSGLIAIDLDLWERRVHQHVADSDYLQNIEEKTGTFVRAAESRQRSVKTAYQAVMRDEHRLSIRPAARPY